jgi:hypothetical protein
MPDLDAPRRRRSLAGQIEIYEPHRINEAVHHDVEGGKHQARRCGE